MKALINGIQWRRHSAGLMWLFLSLVLLAVAGTIHSQQASALAKAQQLYTAQLRVNRTSSDAQDELNLYLKPYAAWMEQGLFGDPQRLTWLESLKAIGSRYKIPRIEFELQSSHVAEVTDTSYFRDTIAITQTPLMLNMRLAHEGDFVNLMSDLRREAKGLFDVKECVLTHFPKENRLNREVSLISACEIVWYSLADATKDWKVTEQPQP